MSREIDVLRTISLALDGLSNEQACRVMAGACVALGECEWALRFIAMAKLHAEEAERKAFAEFREQRKRALPHYVAPIERPAPIVFTKREPTRRNQFYWRGKWRSK